jgi:hypothetical protein
MAFIRLVAIAKDEGAYLPEWIHHHLYFGFDEIVVIHNDCNDNTVEILEKISEKEARLIVKDGNQLKKEVITIGGNFQTSAYANELNLARKDAYVTHIMYLDIDEFWLTPKLDKSIHEFINNFKEADSISFAWHFEHPNDPKIFSPTLSKNLNIQKDKHVKSIHKISDRFIRPDIHNGTHTDGIYLTSNGIVFPSIIFNGAERAGLSDDLFKCDLNNPDLGFIYHRIFRSQKEYLATLFRGQSQNNSSAKIKSNRWGYQSFDKDIPIITITLDSETIDILYKSYELFLFNNNLITHLKVAQNKVIDNYKKVLDIITDLDYEVSDYLKLFDEVNIDQAKSIIETRKKFFFHIDSITPSIKAVTIKGWALISDSNVPVKLSVSSKLNYSFKSKNHDRPDVFEKFPNSTNRAGFEIQVSNTDFFKLEFNFDINVEKIQFSKSFSSLQFPINLAYFFSEEALRSNFILEYGAGTSTKFLVKNSKKCMSVESDSRFLLNLLEDISLSGLNITTTPVHINIGETKEWGYPVDNSSKFSWHDYPLKPWKILASNDISPDLVLIDGRFRVACMLATMASIKKPTKVIFDDYVDRPYKKIVEKYCKPLKIIDRAAYFELAPGILSASDLLDCFDQFFDPS